ncbi:hypothetical protein CR513_45699, partial [Mucuna pruriens]
MDISTPWFVDICNFIVASQFPPEASRLYNEKIKSDAKYYIWDDPYLWKCGSDHVIRRSQRRPSWIDPDSSKGTRLWGFTGPSIFEMPTNSSRPTNNASE